MRLCSFPCAAILVLAAACSLLAQPARFVAYHGYAKAVELNRGNVRAVLCPAVGGRVLEFSLDGKNSLRLDDEEGDRQPGKQPAVSAGRFDFGPEMTTPAHQKIWSGEWQAEITSEFSARLTSQRDESSGVQLTRQFELREQSSPTSGLNPVHLSCRQTITNVSDQLREYCHWGRSFADGGGICLIPLSGQSRFPSKYALYEGRGLINVQAKDDNIRERDGFLEILGPPKMPKLGFDSYAGWLAYVMPGDLLFVKKFATYPDRVYNEAAGLTISVWYPVGNRVELEPIGPRERLKPGESASFTEEWHLGKFPFPKTGETIDLTKLKALVNP
jgi:hypothetical protein